MFYANVKKDTGDHLFGVKPVEKIFILPKRFEATCTDEEKESKELYKNKCMDLVSPCSAHGAYSSKVQCSKSNTVKL